MESPREAKSWLRRACALCPRTPRCWEVPGMGWGETQPQATSSQLGPGPTQGASPAMRHAKQSQLKEKGYLEKASVKIKG